MESDKGQTESSDQAEFDRFDHTFSVLCPVVEGDDRRDTIVQTEHRHEEETLKLEIYTEHSGCCG